MWLGEADALTETEGLADTEWLGEEDGEEAGMSTVTMPTLTCTMSDGKPP